MRSVIAGTLLVLAVSNDAQHQMQDTLSKRGDNLVDSLVDHVVDGSVQADLDATMLGMLGRSGLLPSASPTLRFRADRSPVWKGPSFTSGTVGAASRGDVHTDLRAPVHDPDVLLHRTKFRLALKDPKVQTRMKTLLHEPEFKPVYDNMVRSRSEGKVVDATSFTDPVFMHKYIQRLAATPAMAEALENIPVVVREDQVQSLHDAIRLKDPDKMRLTSKLLAAGKNPNEVNADGTTPLAVAIAIQSTPVVKALTAAGAKTTAVDSKGNTPLHYAAVIGSVPIITTLLDAGADPTALNQVGRSPVDIILRKPKSLVASDTALMARLTAGRGARTNRAKTWIASLNKAARSIARNIFVSLPHA